MTVKQLDMLGRIGSISSGIGVLVLLVKYGIGAGLIGFGCAWRNRIMVPSLVYLLSAWKIYFKNWKRCDGGNE